MFSFVWVFVLAGVSQRAPIREKMIIPEAAILCSHSNSHGKAGPNGPYPNIS